jgi:hypothetical protein
MNHSPDHRHLLADVLADTSPAGFREALLGETLRLARRRSQWRQVRRSAAVMAALVLAVAGLWWKLSGPAKAKPATGCLVVRTQPLSPAQIVTTQRLAPAQLVASVACANVVLTVSGGFREIGDDELLALVAPQVAALVRRGPHEAELIFVETNEPSPKPN